MIGQVISDGGYRWEPALGDVGGGGGRGSELTRWRCRSEPQCSAGRSRACWLTSVSTHGGTVKISTDAFVLLPNPSVSRSAPRSHDDETLTEHARVEE